MDSGEPKVDRVAGGALVTKIETPADARQAARDAALVRRLVHDPAWVMPEGSDKRLPEIMYGIAQQATARSVTAEGPCEVDNFRMQIEATKTLIAMRGQNQADRHHAEGSTIKGEVVHRVELVEQAPAALQDMRKIVENEAKGKTESGA